MNKKTIFKILNYFFLIVFVGLAIWNVVDSLSHSVIQLSSFSFYDIDWFGLLTDTLTLLLLACYPALNLFASGWLNKFSYIFFLAGIVCFFTPNVFTPVYHGPKPNNDTKMDLHNFHLACKYFWTKNGSEKNCNASIVSNDEYGFVQSTDVTVKGNGSEKTFNAKASNINSKDVFGINANGEIFEAGK